MTRTTQFILRAAPSPSRAACSKFIWTCPNDWIVTIKPPTRSNLANAKMHVVLGQLVQANVKYRGRQMDVENWKDLLAASLKSSQEIKSNMVQSLDGDGYVLMGNHTSDLSISEMNEIIERAYCIGAQNDPPVRFVEDIEPHGRPK